MALVRTDLLQKMESMLNEISVYDGMDNEKIELYIKKLSEVKKYKSNLLELDLNLKEYLYQSRNGNEIISDTDIQSKLNEIRDDSLIIYVKKAQLYKIYDPAKIDDFQNDEGTHYRRSEYGPAYEVVRDSHPQKLMIVITDEVEENRLPEIKAHILEYIKKTPAFSKTTTTDLKVYSNDNNTEFVVSSLMFKNMDEKEKFIESFIKFIRQKGAEDIAGKIQIRYPPCDELTGARLYKIPSLKMALSSNTPTNLLDQMITTLPKSNGPIIINNNTFIINNNSNNTVNNSVTNTIAVSDTESHRTLKSFYKHLYNTKPSWYKEDKFIDMSVIEEAYRTYFDDHVTSKSVISRQLNGNLFTASTRASKIVKKRLVTYDLLHTLF